ncbi:hypothetical protein G7Y89_g12172 [Cudoniella acicularis]|uniref:PinX1-related protein 1 n=1 Tax=Cudoniella acicularis TaxID=354080 RepID=A0A8H4VXL8_9HELO|nr:hypothetical protein G7Y89_g12172 [Cudoniella acicularis]
MGLAAPKNRMKRSHDPNNTAWTNNTDSFGHKIMKSQGWEPGQYLGAKDAAHAEFHTAANASHIRVMIKDDNLGLGAKIGSGVGHGECTGLDAFKNILGRLNGKDEDEIAKEQQSREDLKRAIYTERRWGNIRFVQGGFLIGDKIEHLIEAEAERIRNLSMDSSNNTSETSSSSESEEEAPAPVEKTKKSKKRKIDIVDEEDVKAVTENVKRSKKKRNVESEPEKAEDAQISDTKKSKKSKKDRKLKEETESTSENSERRKRKEAKRERRKLKEAKKEKKASKVESKEDEKSSKKSKREKKKVAGDVSVLGSSESSAATTKESTPSIPTTTESSGRSTPMMQGRHAVRSRNIAQKRLAHMDIAALNQVNIPLLYGLQSALTFHRFL